jgi:uncharacterized protein with HEPN domain
MDLFNDCVMPSKAYQDLPPTQQQLIRRYAKEFNLEREAYTNLQIQTDSALSVRNEKIAVIGRETVKCLTKAAKDAKTDLGFKYLGEVRNRFLQYYATLKIERHLLSEYSMR